MGSKRISALISYITVILKQFKIMFCSFCYSVIADLVTYELKWLSLFVCCQFEKHYLVTIILEANLHNKMQNYFLCLNFSTVF